MPTRKRDRRVSASAEIASRNNLARKTPQSARRSTSSFFLSILLPTVIILLACLLPIFIAIFFGNYSQIFQDSPILPVYERGLVKSQITHRDVLSEFKRVSTNTSARHFLNPVLAYVTPWNSLGYAMAEKFRFKLTHVSPVWYDLKRAKNRYVLEGQHNFDQEWISRLKTNPNLLVIPRVVLEVPPSEILKNKKHRKEVIDVVTSECKEMRYDGIVLEAWSRWAAHGVLHDIGLRRKALEFIKELAIQLHSMNLELVFVIPAPRSNKVNDFDFGRDDVDQLVDFVDGFSLMTYDFSGPHNPGPNAPLPWIRSTLELLLGDNKRETAHKIFMGINFYGNDFLLSEGLGSESLLGKDYLSLLKKKKPALQWETESSEHYFLYVDDRGRQHAVFYPSLLSIYLRLDAARSLGASLSIWEIGQGLDYFFDLL